MRGPETAAAFGAPASRLAGGEGRPATRCRRASSKAGGAVHASSTGTGKRVVLMGDSHARMWLPAFIEIAKQRSWSCRFSRSRPARGRTTCRWSFRRSNSARLQQADWYGRVIPKLDPDLIILVAPGVRRSRPRASVRGPGWYRSAGHTAGRALAATGVVGVVARTGAARSPRS